MFTTNGIEVLETIFGRQFYVNSSPKQEDHSETASGKTLQKVN